jgi:hypothetical protein
MIHGKILSELAQIDREKIHLCLAHNRGREEKRERESQRVATRHRNMKLGSNT